MVETLKIKSAQIVDGTRVLPTWFNKTLVPLGRQHNSVVNSVK